MLATVVHAAALEAAAAAAARPAGGGRNPAGYLPAQRSRGKVRDALARSRTFSLCRGCARAGGVGCRTSSAQRAQVPCLGCGCALYTTVGDSVYTNVSASGFLCACMCVRAREYVRVGSLNVLVEARKCPPLPPPLLSFSRGGHDTPTLPAPLFA